MLKWIMYILLCTLPLLGINSSAKPLNNDGGIILLTFNGYNTQLPILGDYTNFAPAALPTQVELVIRQRVADLFKNYAVTVSTSDSLYNTYPKNRRIRCIVTSTPLVLHFMNFPFIYAYPIGGYSNINSLRTGDTTACVVSTDGITANPRLIGEGVAHEVGHSLGLYHKSVWHNKEITEVYDHGTYLFAPIMGFTGYSIDCGWTTGVDQLGRLVNDDTVIQRTFRRLTKAELKQKSKYFNKP